MATLNLGRIKPVFRGAYSGSTAYVVDDIVTHGNESFICIQAHGAGTQATSVTAYWTKLAAKGTDGTDIGTTITTQGDILFRDGSGLQRLAKGTAAQTLKMNSGATAPEWTTVAAASTDYEKIASWDWSTNVSDINFDNIFTSTYSIIRFVAYNIRPTAAGSGSWIRLGFRTGGASGSNWSTTYYQKAHDGYGDYTTASGGGWAIQNDSVGVQVMNTWAMQTTGDYSKYRNSIIAEFPNFQATSVGGDATFPIFNFVSQFNDAAHIGQHSGIGYVHASPPSAITGLRVNMEANSLESGNIRIYGIK